MMTAACISATWVAEAGRSVVQIPCYCTSVDFRGICTLLEHFLSCNFSLLLYFLSATFLENESLGLFFKGVEKTQILFVLNTIYL